MILALPAAERTLLAWQRTAIALIGLGPVVERFGLFLRKGSNGAQLPRGHARKSLASGTLVTGAAVALLYTLQFNKLLRELSHPDSAWASDLGWPARQLGAGGGRARNGRLVRDCGARGWIAEQLFWRRMTRRMA
jgi:hypothetical protein